MNATAAQETKALITCEGLQGLIRALDGAGYQVLGPTVRDGAIVYDTIAGVENLPAGWTDRQEAGRYHLERRDDGALLDSPSVRNRGSNSCIRRS